MPVSIWILAALVAPSGGIAESAHKLNICISRDNVPFGEVMQAEAITE
jgi:hypothetical protein